MIIACHYDPENRRGAHVAKAMIRGAQRLGIKVVAVPGFQQPAGDVGIAYGWAHPGLFDAYRAAGGQAVYIDLGWWNRKPTGDVLGGHHKVVVDGREPGPYFRRNSPPDRFAQMRLRLAPWRQTGHHLLVAGMSEKSARTRGWEPQQWETAIIAGLRKGYPSRPVLYRPKGSWAGATPIPGSVFNKDRPLETALAGCWGVVAHYSNVAVDALLEGVPISVDGGVAKEFSVPMDAFDSFKPMGGRADLMADIAYQQWTPVEMAEGHCLRYFMDIGAIRT